MKSQQKKFLAFSLAGIGALGALASVSAETIAASTTTSAPSTTTARPFGRMHHDLAHAAIKLAITNGDYQAFLAANVNKPANALTITEAQFKTMVQAEKLHAAGDETAAKKLLDDAGIKGPGSRGMGDMPVFTDAQKATMQQARTLFEAGKQTEAKALLDTAGIKMPVGGRGEHHDNAEMKAFMGTLTDTQKAALKQSHELIKAGKKTEADAVLTAAGITLPTRPAAPSTTTQ